MEGGFHCNQVPGWDDTCCVVCHDRKKPHVFKVDGKQFNICCKFSLSFVQANSGQEFEIIEVMDFA